MDTVESLEKICTSVDDGPNNILYESCSEKNYSILVEMFLKNVRVYSLINIENGALIKARIMDGEKKVMCYNSESSEDVSTKINICKNPNEQLQKTIYYK